MAMVKKERILLICSEPFSATWAYFSLAVMKALQKQERYQVSFLYLQVNASTEYEKLIDESVQRIPFRLPMNKYLRQIARILPLGLFVKIWRLHLKYNFQCAHSLITGYVLANILRFFPKKMHLVYTVHDATPHECHRTNLFSRYLFYSERKAIKEVPYLATSSQTQVCLLRNMYPSKKVFYFPMPSHISETIQHGNLICPEILNEKGYLLFFGGVNLYKGIELLVKSFIGSSFSNNLKLVIAGAGSYNPLDGISNPNIILINRHIEDSEVRSLFENARCVVYPYISITQTAVVQFPYYFRTPVITSDLDYFKDCIVDGKTGFLFENKNVDQLSKLLEYVCSDQFDPKPMKLAMAEQYEKCYSEERLGKALVDMYELVGKEKKE